MSTLTSPTASVPTIERFKFTVEDYFRLAEVGILKHDDRVELVQGEIIRMAPIGRMHAGIVNQLNRHFQRLDPAVIVAVQNPVRLDERNDPQPDIMLLKPDPDDYKTKTVVGSDVLLIVEVADSTFAYDYEMKRPLYAKYGIPETWILDLARRCAHVCRHPVNGAYQNEHAFRGRQTLAPLGFPDHQITVAALLE